MNLDDMHEAWRVNNAVNLELLDRVSDADLELKPGKGKTIRSNFVHLISVRKMWSEEKLKKECAELPKLDWKAASRDEMKKGLDQSSEIMQLLFEKMEAASKPGRWPTMMFFAYAIAHEAHHRSQIEIALRINGREPEDGFLYGLWEWNRK